MRGGGWQAYLRSRRDTIRCIVAALTDDAQGAEPGAGESLFDELSRPADAEVPHRPSPAALAHPAAHPNEKQAWPLTREYPDMSSTMQPKHSIHYPVSTQGGDESPSMRKK